MAQRLAIEHSHHFAAIAVVAASLSKSFARRFIHGTADPVTP